MPPSITSALVKRGSRRKRVYRATDAYLLREEGVLLTQAESASEADLTDMTRARLRAAALAFDVPSIKVKDTKAKLVASILAHRANLFAACACGEPVDNAGDVCEPCSDAATSAPRTRSPRSNRGTGTGTVRKPDVTLDATLDVAALAVIAHEARSSRAAQRELAKAVAVDGFVGAEVLRTLLRKFGRLSAPNFTLNMKKDGFTAVREGRKILGWTL